MALHKTLLKKRLKYWHPLPPKTSYCDKTLGSRELIFGTIHIKKCMDNLEFFQPNLRWSSGEFSLNCHVWRGMTLLSSATLTKEISPANSLNTNNLLNARPERRTFWITVTPPRSKERSVGQ